jgi:hypothetical protein
MAFKISRFASKWLTLYYSFANLCKFIVTPVKYVVRTVFYGTKTLTGSFFECRDRESRLRSRRDSSRPSCLIKNINRKWETNRKWDQPWWAWRTGSFPALLRWQLPVASPEFASELKHCWYLREWFNVGEIRMFNVLCKK